MKLVFVTDNGFSFKDDKFYYSGANVQHYATVTKFFNKIVFIARKSEFEESSSEISSEYSTHLISSVTSKGNIISNYIELNHILEDEIKDANLVMCFGLNGYFAYTVAKKYKKPILAYVGGCVYDTLKFMDSKIKKLLAPFMYRLIKKMVFNADYVHYVDEYLQKKYPTNGKTLICSSVKIEIIQDILIKRINKIEKEKKIIKIGIIGYTHNRIKGIDTAIKSLSLLDQNYILQVVGRGNHQWLDEIAKELNIFDRIEFLGILSGREKIFEWLDSIDIYIQPSLTEGMPRATIEAMSRGCPIVSSSVGGLEKLIDKNFRIDLNDYNDLANKIDTISNINCMKDQAIKNFNICKGFDYKILEEKRNRFYKSIITT